MSSRAPRIKTFNHIPHLGTMVAAMAWVLIYFDTALPTSVRILLSALILTYTAARLLIMACRSQGIRLDPTATILVTAALAFAAAQQLNSLARGIEIADSMPYLLIIAAAFPFSIFALILRNDALMMSFEVVSTLFSITVIALGIVFYIDTQLFFDTLNLLNIDRGFFGAKKSVEGEEFANVYFPATLLLVPHCLYSLHQRSWLKFTLGIFALFIAPSRFGVTVVAIMSATMLLLRTQGHTNQSHWGRLVRNVIFAVLVISLPLGLLHLLSIFQLSDDGWLIRLAHLNAVVREFEASPSSILWGFGAGSTFYTEGFGAITDNIEISQLELVRKYGLIGFMLITIATFTVIIYSAKKRGIQSAFALVGYYICALSNPVLLTLGSMLLFVSNYCSCSRENE